MIRTYYSGNMSMNWISYWLGITGILHFIFLFIRLTKIFYFEYDSGFDRI